MKQQLIAFVCMLHFESLALADAPMFAPRIYRATKFRVGSSNVNWRHVSLSDDQNYALTTSSVDHVAILWDVKSAKVVNALVANTTVTHVAFLSDGTPLTCSKDGEILFWHPKIGEPIRRIDVGVRVSFFDLDRATKLLVTVSVGREVVVWDTATMKKRQSFSVSQGTGRKYGIKSLSISGDGTRMITARDDGHFASWNLESGQLIKSWDARSRSRNIADLSDDGQFAVLGRYGHLPVIWNIIEPTKIAVIRAEKPFGTPRTVRINSDGTKVLIGRYGSKQPLSVWYAANPNKTPRVLEGHTASVRAVEFSNDGRRFITASRDRTVRIWDAQSHNQLQVLRSSLRRTKKVRVHRDRRKLLVHSDNDLRLWDLEALRVRTVADIAGCTDLKVTSGFSRIAALIDGNIVLWNDLGSQKLGELKFEENARCRQMILSDDGSRLATVHQNREVNLWDVSTLKQLSSFKHGLPTFRSMSVTADMKYVVVRTQNYVPVKDSAELWNLANGKLVERVRILKGKLRFSESSSQLLSDANSCKMSIVKDTTDASQPKWSISDSQMRGSYKDSTGKVATLNLVEYRGTDDWLAFTSDGRYDGSENGRKSVNYRIQAEPNPDLSSNPDAVSRVAKEQDAARERLYSPGLIAEFLSNK